MPEARASGDTIGEGQDLLVSYLDSIKNPRNVTVYVGKDSDGLYKAAQAKRFRVEVDEFMRKGCWKGHEILY